MLCGRTGGIRIYDRNLQRNQRAPQLRLSYRIPRPDRSTLVVDEMQLFDHNLFLCSETYKRSASAERALRIVIRDVRTGQSLRKLVRTQASDLAFLCCDATRLFVGEYEGTLACYDFAITKLKVTRCRLADFTSSACPYSERRDRSGKRVSANSVRPKSVRGRGPHPRWDFSVLAGPRQKPPAPS